jgi:hypothetical protein
MKLLSILGSLAVSMSFAGGSLAQGSDYLGQNAAGAAEARAQPASLPPGVQLVELERWHFRSDTFSARPFAPSSPWQHPGVRQGVLGFISYYPFEGARTLYNCHTNDYRDRFTSPDENCEGHILMTNASPITGYIAATQLPGTVPVYRCMRGGLSPGNWADHFDSLDVNCEGVKHPANDGIIGYIWQ